MVDPLIFAGRSDHPALAFGRYLLKRDEIGNVKG
jgi:hypothetical protein